MQDATRLDKVTGQIRALLNTSGCTEQEAISRTEKATELMSKYQITLTDAEVRQTSVLYETFDRSEQYALAAVDHCFEGIQLLCGVRMFMKPRVEKTLFGAEHKVRLLAILGAQPDLEFAHWLYDMLDDTIERASEAFKAQTRKYTDDVVSSFEVAMAARINTRLKAMAEAAKPNVTTDGKALIVVKDGMLTEAIDTMGLKLKSQQDGKAHDKDSGAYAAGAAAGDKVQIHKPIAGGSTDKVEQQRYIGA